MKIFFLNPEHVGSMQQLQCNLDFQIYLLQRFCADEFSGPAGPRPDEKEENRKKQKISTKLHL